MQQTLRFNESPLLCSLYGRKLKREGTCPPPFLSPSFLMVMWVRSSIPDTICPSSGSAPQALWTYSIVCVCPSRKWWTHMVLEALCEEHEPAGHYPACDRGRGRLACPVCGHIRTTPMSTLWVHTLCHCEWPLAAGQQSGDCVIFHVGSKAGVIAF